MLGAFIAFLVLFSAIKIFERDRDDPRFLPHTTSFEGKRIYHPLLEKVFAIAKK